jgi:hypothetical protein
MSGIGAIRRSGLQKKRSRLDGSEHDDAFFGHPEPSNFEFAP